MRLVPLALLCGACAISVRADQLIMKNGDRYSGRLDVMEGGKVKFQAEYAGTITVPFDEVETIRSQDTFVVRTKTGGVESAPPERILAMRGEVESVWSRAEQERARRSVERASEPVWSGSTDIGISLAAGNTDTQTLSGAVNATRVTPSTKLGFYGNSLYSRAVRDGQRLVAANLRRGGFRYDLNFSPKQFTFVSGDLDHNPIQNLTLRSVLGVGFGRHLMQTKRNTLDLFAGGTFNREEFRATDARYAGEGLFSEASTHKINGSFSLSQRFAIYPNLTERGAYRMTLDSSAVTSLMRWLSWQITVSNRYISNPPTGTRPNDLLVTTGFRVSFGAKK